MKISCISQPYAVGILFLVFLHAKAGAQNIINDTVHVASTSIVQITFHSPIDKASMPNGDRSYEATVTNMSVMLTALKKDAKNQLLIVREGNREHKFILSFKENTPPRVIDWSDLKKLDEYTKKNRPTTVESEGLPDTKSAGAKKTAAGEPAEKTDVPANVTGADKSRNALAEANAFFKQGRLQEAKQKYLEVTDPDFADLIKPRVAEIDKQIKEQASRLGETEKIFKDYVARGDRAYNNNLLDEAGTNYSEALKIKPDNTALKNKLAGIQVKKDNAIFGSWKKKGDSALNKKDFITARMAYEEALKIKAGDNYITGKMQDLQRAENQPAYQEARKTDSIKRVEYAKAIATADKFYEVKGYEFAAEEYMRAARIFPDSTYANNQLKKINGLRPDLQKDKSAKETKN